MISSYTFLSSTLFSPKAVDAVFLIWAGSNYDKTPFTRMLEYAIQDLLQKLPGQMPFLVLDRFAYIARQTAGKWDRPSSMSSFQNVLGIIYSGYSVGCSGFAELYSLGNVQSQCSVQSSLDLMHSSQACPFYLLPRSILYPRTMQTKCRAFGTTPPTMWDVPTSLCTCSRAART
jgi:hypothetical protein